MTYTFTTHSAAGTTALGRMIGERLRGGECIAYMGGLGAGKTTMTRGIAIGMGLDDEVTSPTFALVNEYRGEKLSLCHFDMYRITSAEDLETTGFYDYMDEDTVLAVEWSENIADALPPDTVFITLERLSDEDRKITVNGDERFADIGDRHLG
ncbi:MAG: tRNA (adenosine(37)-N6)-threonylcarbamoyltransferase complex ATPase subunit type 1 TsaE [Ruminococcus sp.]|nr:tRNA (adenosine(37)-N6)-threonylcarbamoyltransferase complex ATPase subunit type 1 TsaE [Ruminococcus sp.]